MKTSLNIDDDLLKQAMQATGTNEKTAVIHMGLRLIVEKAARDRLIKLGGRVRGIKSVPRR